VRTENQIDPAEFTLPAAIVTSYRLALAAQGSLKTYTGLLLIERLKKKNVIPIKKSFFT
jgi:hypothetical protein